MALSSFATPVEDRYFEDYIPGSVHEFGSILREVVMTMEAAKFLRCRKMA
jgi:hypothetical protein